MKIIYFPDKNKVKKAMKEDDPLLMLISFDGKKLLISNIDDALEHVVLLKKLGFRESEIDSYFRVIANKEGADWTFVCPGEYKNISDKEQRIKTYYVDGIKIISKSLEAIKYKIEITIPKRYRRHMDIMGGKS